MTTITIPKTIDKTQNLVAISRAAYEEFLTWQKLVKSQHTFVPSIADKKALAQARKNFGKGRYLTLKEAYGSVEHTA